MIYDDNGNPKFLGYSVEPYWGEYWVCRVASKLMLSTEDAIKLLETGGHGGGHGGGHCDEKVVFSWLAD